MEQFALSERQAQAILSMPLQRLTGLERDTEIVYGAEEFDIEDLIAEEDMVVTISREDYVKRLSLKAYRVQNRGGRGVTGHEDQGGVFRRASFRGIDALLYHVPHLQGQVPLAQGLPYSRGRPIVNPLPLDQDDKICAIVPVR